MATTITVKPPKSEQDQPRKAKRVEDAIAEERRHTPHTERFTADPETMRALLAAVVESSDDAIVAKDLNGTILAWNDAAERIFGYRADEAIGQSITILLPPERLQEEATVLAALRSGRRIDHYETERVRKDGARLRISLSVSPIRDASGNIIGAAKIARDVTARYEMEQEREALLGREQQARHAAEAANRAKDAFLATVSHELRTPLSPIIMWTRMLRDGLLDPTKAEKALVTIERNARTQAQIVDDLLDVSRIVSGKMRLEVRPTDLGAVIQSAADVVRPAADAKGIQMSVVLDTETGFVAGDPDRLQQVVWNLLSNAVKFTPKQGRVQIVLERVNSHVEIAVTDTGEGFDPEFRRAMFDRFQQADSSASRHHGGLGLGLAIARHIVELHGGTVHGESAGPGQGATFTVKLPLAIFQRAAGETERRHPTLSEQPSPSTLDAYARLDGVRVLVVDDEPDSNEAVSALLAARGAEVRVAASASQAIEVLRGWLPTVMVTDIGMPGEDGYMLLAKVRAGDGAAARVPAIALTAYANRDDRLRTLAAGFQLHMSKPIDAAELVAAVANVAQTSPRA